MLVDDLYQYVLDMLSANHESCERISLFQKPSKQFIIGSLADSSKDYSIGSSIGENKVQAKSALRHNSMSIFFLIAKSSNEQITIVSKCSVYFKAFPTFEEQFEHIKSLDRDDVDESVKKDPGFKPYYKKLKCVFNPITVKLKDEIFSLDFTDVISEVKDDDDLYRTNNTNPTIKASLEGKEIKNSFDPEWVIDENTYNNILDEIKTSKSKKPFNWKAQIEIERERFIEEIDIITVRFINTTGGKGKGKYEKFLFNCQLEVKLSNLTLIPFKYKFKYEDFYYNETGLLRALNCQAYHDISSNVIKTKPYAKFEQKKKIPRTAFNGIDAKFKDLKSSLDQLDLLSNEMDNQLEKYTHHPYHNNSNHQFNAQFLKETQNFKKILDRFQDGIHILKNNEKARRSFLLMNEVFEESSIYEGWRLFQIVFITMLIPDIVNVGKNREFVDVMHVDTGGGKSEGYFGLVVFLLFWDRLRGKLLGVSAISKFPLRMLSIQQLTRIAKIVVIAEELRKERNIEGEPFTVGYYVGVSEDFPRHAYDKIIEIENNEKRGKKINGVLLENCPKCNGKVFLIVDKEKRQIIHECESCNRKFYLYFTNSEIYRFIPSILISTVDKLASIALNRRFKNLFGGKLSLCNKGHGFSSRNDKCDVKIRPKSGCDAETTIFEQTVEGPTLMIQDEMHLLREGFGTIDSHFESLMNTLLKKLSSGKEFKYIAMTATVSGARDQIDHLYGKKHLIFPGKVPRGFDENGDLFYEYPVDVEGKPQTQRILIGLKPNLRDNQYASLLTIHHLTIFLQKIKLDKAEYAKANGLSLPQLEEDLKKYQCLLTYHGKKADVFGMKYFLHTVVTSKLTDFDISGKTLTGDNTLTEIKEAITTIQDYSEEPQNYNTLHATFATSVVSHGVDLDKWNLMIFQGITRNTSEYIQALSRVGRRYTGLIFLWFYPNRVRDLSYYKNFNLYHKILPLKVEKTPISRWTKLGFKQTITSIFCAAILNYISDVEEIPLYTVKAVNQFFDFSDNRKKLVDFIKDAYYTNLNRVGASWVRDQIGDEVEERLNYLKTYSGSIHKNFFPNALRDSMEKYYKTQYGMRGIQEQITLKLNERYSTFISKYKKRDQ